VYVGSLGEESMHRWISSLAVAVVLAISGLGLSGPLAAQDAFPSGPLTMIVTGPEGEDLHAIHRKLAELAEPILGVKIEIRNVPGGGGTEGVSALVGAKADGLTIAAVRSASITVAPHTGSVTYGIEDITPIIQTTGGAPLVVCAPPRFPAGDAEDFVELVEENPGKYTYGTDGVGGIAQILVEHIFRPLKLDLRPVHFEGPDEAMKAFIGHEVDIFIGRISTLLVGQTKEGYAKCLLVTSVEPSRSLEDVDALDEIDAENRAMEVWRGLIAPKGTPPERVKILAEAFHKAASVDEFKYYVLRRHDFVRVGTSEAFADLIESESKAFADVVKNIEPAKK